jgi:hypothetical protein
MHYTNYSASKDAIKEAVSAGNYDEFERIERLVTPIPRTSWDVYTKETYYTSKETYYTSWDVYIKRDLLHIKLERDLLHILGRVHQKRPLHIKRDLLHIGTCTSWVRCLQNSKEGLVQHQKRPLHIKRDLLHIIRDLLHIKRDLLHIRRGWYSAHGRGQMNYSIK